MAIINVVGVVGISDKGTWQKGYSFIDTVTGETVTGYDEGDIVHTSKGIYRSLADGNTADPDTDTSKWEVELNTSILEEAKVTLAETKATLEEVHTQLDGFVPRLDKMEETTEGIDSKFETLTKRLDEAESTAEDMSTKIEALTERLGVVEKKQEVIIASKAEFPAEGATGILYVASDTQTSYIWDAGTKAYKQLVGLDYTVIG